MLCFEKLKISWLSIQTILEDAELKIRISLMLAEVDESYMVTC